MTPRDSSASTANCSRRNIPSRTDLFRRPNFFQFQTPDGGVFLHCVDMSCLIVERASRETYDHIEHAVGWPAAPAPQPEHKQEVAAIRP